VNEIEHPEHLITRDLGGIPEFSNMQQQYPAIFVILVLQYVEDMVVHEALLLVVWHQIVQQSCILLLEIRNALHERQGALRIELAWSQEDHKEVIVGGKENGLVL